MKRALLLLLVAACGDGGGDDESCAIPGGGPGVDPSGAFCAKLSSYRLFEDIAAQQPAEDVVPYGVNTALFSDYAAKDRFVFLPHGTAMTWSDRDAFAMPDGAVVVKTFSYPRDRRDPAAGRRLLETRLLIHTEGHWRGASYVYDEAAPGDAKLAVAGAMIDTSWIHDDGTERTNRYAVPNQNQCKNCHAEHDGVIDLLGPKARHLPHDQLSDFVEWGMLAGAPPAAAWPRAIDAFDASTGTLEERARAWLDINCANCHNERGAARTSGLYLDIAQTNPDVLGVCKAPVAAGTGSGGRRFAIVPGKPDESILVYRIESVQPQIKMPELGRNLVHAEGVALIREWITGLPGSCN
ncbi:MAG: SO2930 family diheme c-type cytochrome [Kofleriaceae bacterium]